VVREDPARAELLFAGTERAVYVSFNDGDDWQPLRLNMPATSVRDLVIHNDDVVVGTHGRSFWILDDITPLRQINEQIARTEAHLFQPQVAYRVKRNVNTDTPLPPEEPAGKNPPDGAIINYYLQADASGPITLEIFDEKQQLLWHASSVHQPATADEKDHNLPGYWFRPPQLLSAKAGMHRFIWDLNYPPPWAFRYDYPISAIYGDTPPYPLGPAVLPGNYTVKLTAGGRSYLQPLTVKLDPRVKTTPEDLAQQFAFSMQAYRSMQQSFEAIEAIKKFNAQVTELRHRVGQGALSEALALLGQRASAIGGEGRADQGSPGVPGGAVDARDADLTKLHAAFAAMLELFQSADAAPTTQARAASGELQNALTKLLTRWNELRTKELKALNEQLRQANLPPFNP
jgi:hypothetical protein